VYTIDFSLSSLTHLNYPQNHNPQSQQIWHCPCTSNKIHSRWTETRGLINSPTSTTTCSPRIWAANGD